MSILQDVRFAIRLLLKSPAFTLVAVATLGLAVAANTVVFSVVDAVLIRPLPYADSRALVRIDTQFKSQSLDKFWVSAPEYLALVHDAQSYSSLGAWTLDTVNLTGGDQPVAVDTVDVTASLLPTLGVQPMLGRFFDASEDTPGDPRAVIMSYGLWKRAFGGDPGIVGKTVHADGIPVTVVGVMPKGFEFPQGGIDLWVPVRINPAKARPGNHYLTIVGRLKPGVDVGAARAELATLGAAWHAADPKGHVIDADGHPMVVERLFDDVVGAVRAALLTLEAAVVFVLLIACANVSNLLLARAEARSGEIAIRAALGATRGRMARQFLTESLVLGLLGAAVGIVLAVWGLDGTIAMLPEGVPRTSEIALDPTVLAFAVGVSILASLVFGLAPILHAHGNLGETLRSAGQRATGSARKQIFRRALVVIEVGLAIVLVTGAGLMVRSFVRLQRVDLGFEPRGLVTLDLNLPAKSYPADDDVAAFWKRLHDGAVGLPGVKSAALVSGLPPVRQLNANDFEIVGKTYVMGMPSWGIDFWQIASEDAMDTLGIRVIAGRGIERTDVETSPGVVLINDAMAKKFWPGEDPIGKRIRVSSGSAGPGKADPEQTIVGIVADVKQQGIEAPAGTEVFIPQRQTLQEGGFEARTLHLVVRAEGDPRALFGTLRAYVASLDANLPLANLKTMDRVVFDAIAKPRFVTTLLAAFAGIALLMAAIGIYGVMSYTVERRTQELGIRMALGADAGRLKTMLVQQGLALAAGGVVLGLVAAAAVNIALAQWLARLVFDLGSLDPMTYAAVIVLTIGVAALACYLPARRATRIHPVTAMRHE